MTSSCPACSAPVRARTLAQLAAAMQSAAAIVARQPDAAGRAAVESAHLALLREELCGYCTNCIIRRAADRRAEARSGAPRTAEQIEADYVADTEAAMEAATDPRHLCVVIPFPVRASSMTRDLLFDIPGAPEQP